MQKEKEKQRNSLLKVKYPWLLAVMEKERVKRRNSLLDAIICGCLQSRRVFLKQHRATTIGITFCIRARLIIIRNGYHSWMIIIRLRRLPRDLMYCNNINCTYIIADIIKFTYCCQQNFFFVFFNQQSKEAWPLDLFIVTTWTALRSTKKTQETADSTPLSN